MFPFTINEIQNLQADSLYDLSFLDSQGILLRPNEDINSFKQRIIKLKNAIDEVDERLDDGKKYEVFDNVAVSKDQRISLEILSDASNITESKYKFSINWVPGFFLTEKLGFLWGGCAAFDPDNGLSIFLIRSNFAKKKKWLIYSREELLSHELCHVARMPLDDVAYEEHFAYNISFSTFRKYIGNCFQNGYDSILFIIPIFLMMFAQIAQIFFYRELPLWIFSIFAIIYPLFLFIRNFYYRKIYFKALKNLNLIYPKSSEAILFRLVKDEIKALSILKSKEEVKEWLKINSKKDLRWKIITGNAELLLGNNCTVRK